MDLKLVIDIILKRIWFISLFPIIVAIVVAIINIFVLKPVFVADTTLYIMNKNADSTIPVNYYDILAGQQLVKDYREIIKSRAVMNDVIKELNLNGITVGQLTQMVNINLKNDTRIIEIRAQADNAESAREIANTVSKVFLKKIAEITQTHSMSIIDAAQTPTGPSGPNVLLNCLAGFITGLFIALGMVFLIEYLDDTIKDSDDVEKHLGYVVIATIPLMETK